MNRRNFLKSVAAVAVITAAPSMVLAKKKDPYAVLDVAKDGVFNKRSVGNYADFDPKSEYGNPIYLPDSPTIKDLSKIIKRLELDLIKFIPPRYRHKVEYHANMGYDHGRAKCIAWCYSPYKRKGLNG